MRQRASYVVFAVALALRKRRAVRGWCGHPGDRGELSDSEHSLQSALRAGRLRRNLSDRSGSLLFNGVDTYVHFGTPYQVV
jgi:hypothetical protein